MSSRGRSQSQIYNNEQLNNNTIKDFQQKNHPNTRRTSITKEGLNVASFEFSSRRGSQVSF